MSVLRKSNRKASSRQQINIKGVQDGILRLENNRYRAALKTSSINFELKSEDEQDALIESYQAFLNSLTGPVQIMVRVREMDMDKYLEDFNERLEDEKVVVYRKQIQNYTEFVQSLIKDNKILTRSFYIVLSYSAKNKEEFDLVKEQIQLNCDIVAKGLARLGMQTQQLSSVEALDLFYSFYNPERAKIQPLRQQTLQMLKESYL